MAQTKTDLLEIEKEKTNNPVDKQAHDERKANEN